MISIWLTMYKAVTTDIYINIYFLRQKTNITLQELSGKTDEFIKKKLCSTVKGHTH